MSGQLDQVSRSIGGLEASVKSLQSSFDQHCNDDDMRHRENVQTLKEIQMTVNGLAQSVGPLASSVAFMRPIVDGYQVSRWKLTGAVSLAGVILTLVGYVFSLVAGKLLHWIVGAIRF